MDIKEQAKKAAQKAAEKTFENKFNIWKTAKELFEDFKPKS